MDSKSRLNRYPFGGQRVGGVVVKGTEEEGQIDFSFLLFSPPTARRSQALLGQGSRHFVS